MRTNELGFLLSTAFELRQRLRDKPIYNILFIGAQENVLIEDRIIKIEILSGKQGYWIGIGYDEQTGNLFVSYPDG